MSKEINQPGADINPGFEKPRETIQGGPIDQPKQSFTQRVSSGVQSWKQNADFRMRICNTCPHYNAPRCKLCGCFMIAKTKIPQARCPAGKW